MVGTSTGTVHYHFPGKDDVLRAALTHAMDRAFARQSAALKEIDDPRARLLCLIDMQLPRAGELRAEWSVWVQFWAEAMINPDLREIHDQYYGRWRRAVARNVQQGIERGGIAAEVDADEFAHQLTALTDGLAIRVLTDSSGCDVERMRELVVAFVDRSLPVSETP